MADADARGRPLAGEGLGALVGASRHHHTIPGIWDDDNGPIAGHVCATCTAAGRYVATPEEEAAARALTAGGGAFYLDSRGLPHATQEEASRG